MASQNPKLVQLLNGLRPKQRKFAEALIAGQTQKQSAIAAGYSEKTAESQGSRLSRNAKVKAAVEAAAEKGTEKAIEGRERWLKEVRRVGYFVLTKAFDPDGKLLAPHAMDADTQAALASLETDEITEEGVVLGLTRKVKGFDKLKALELEARAEGYIVDKVDVQVSGLEDILTAARKLRDAKKAKAAAK